jgi:hypothetical protein
MRSANKAHRGHAVSLRLECLYGSFDDARVIGQAQIIIGTEIQDAALRHLNLGLLGAHKVPFGFVQAFRPNVRQLLPGDVVQPSVPHRGASW